MAKHHYNCIFIGPSSSIVTGQSFSFKITSFHFGNSLIVGYSSGIVESFIFIYRLIIKRFSVISSCIYLTPSRSFFGSFRDFLVILLFRSLVERIVFHIHGNDLYSFLEKNAIARFFYSYVDRFILLDKEAPIHPSISAKDFFYIDNFVDKQLISCDVYKETYSEQLVISYYSNLMIEKGICIFLDAAYQLLISNANIRFYVAGAIIGTKKEKDKINRKLEKLASFKNFRFFGSLHSTHEKVQFLASSDVVILPTFYPIEAQPISLIEALSFGSYIVSTNQGYIESLLDNFYHSILSEVSVDSLILEINSILELSKSDLRFFSKYNKRLALSRFSLDKYFSSIKQVIS